MKKSLLIIIIAALFSAAVTAQSIPNSFTAGDVISAADMNENFQALLLLINQVEGGGTVGDVVCSMLTEAQFQSQRSTDWVLMDGRDVSGSQYEIVTGNSSLPDARGTFLRSKNNGRADGDENPAGDLPLGTYEADQFQGHYHDYSVTSTALIIKDEPETSSWVESAANDSQHVAWNSSNFSITAPATDGINGTPRTGDETRPKSITVNFFIKIN